MVKAIKTILEISSELLGPVTISGFCDFTFITAYEMKHGYIPVFLLVQIKGAFSIKLLTQNFKYGTGSPEIKKNG